MGINFWGVVYGTKEFLPFIKQTQDGHIINVSSLFGLTAQPTQSGYNATKFAVRGFTESLRQELDIEKCGVSSLCVHPGGIRTNIAKAAKMSDSLSSLGMDPTKSIQNFDKLLPNGISTCFNHCNQMDEIRFKRKKPSIDGFFYKV
ncbi:short-chain dehydrogenase [Acinetobacter baumannii]|nr:short-chain dehydrogenase [Acinetobacter baumannii]